MRFIETPIFTKELQNFLTEENYHSLQLALLFRPEQGKIIRGSGGLRKIRWGTKGSGKRGGSKQEDLTKAQMKILSRLVKEEFK